MTLGDIVVVSLGLLSSSVSVIALVLALANERRLRRLEEASEMACGWRWQTREEWAGIEGTVGTGQE